MEIIGFVALVALGGYHIFAAYALNAMSFGFSGKVSKEGVLLFIFGAIFLYTAWQNKPFLIVTQ